MNSSAEEVTTARLAWPIAACAVVVLILYWPATLSLAELWRDTERTTYTHGFLVAGIALWLLWRRRELTHAAAEVPGWWRPVSAMALLCTAIAWQFFFRAGIGAAYLLILPALMLCAVAVLYGPSGVRVAWLPLGFLVFALPIWDYLNPLALGCSIYVARFLLRVFGIPAHFQENLVQIPDGIFAIEGGCSGLHFIIVALATAILMGELRDDKLRMRVCWLAIALVLALTANWIRVTTIILAGHYTHMQSYLVRVSHYGFGWLVFGLALLPLFLLDRRIPARLPLPMPPRGVSPAPAPYWIAICAAILALPMGINALIDARGHDVENVSWLAAAPHARGWMVGPPSGQWRPKLQRPDAEREWEYRRDGSVITVYLARYDSQARGKEFAGFGSRLTGDANVLAIHHEQVRGQKFLVSTVEERGTRAVIWSRYIVDDENFTSPIGAQLWYSMRTMISLRSIPTVVWAVRGACESDCASTEAAIKSLISHLENS